MAGDRSKLTERFLNGSGDPADQDDPIAARLRGFGPLGILAILLILAGNVLLAPLGAFLVLLWVWRSRTPWRAIGYVRPRNWAITAVVGVVFGSAFKFLMKIVVIPLLGAAPVNQAFHYLAGNRAALPGAIIMMIVVAGFGEETLFRGFMFERLSRVLGSSVAARAAIVLFTSALFGLAHYPVQGLTGVEQATITGLVFGTIMAVTWRLPVLMIAHAAYDLTAVALIYGNLESKMAHLIFK